MDGKAWSWSPPVINFKINKNDKCIKFEKYLEPKKWKYYLLLIVHIQLKEKNSILMNWKK